MTVRIRLGPGDHVSGPLDAPIQLLEYGDFECPVCGRAFRELEKVRRALSGRLLFAYRHFPLTGVHPHAALAAEASEAAGAQGRFWEMYGLLFRHSSALEPDPLVTYAEDLGLDVDRFARELEQGRYQARVRRDFMDGARSGVNGTPTLFIQGQRHDGPFEADALLEALQGGPAAGP